MVYVWEDAEGLLYKNTGSLCNNVNSSRLLARFFFLYWLASSFQILMQIHENIKHEYTNIEANTSILLIENNFFIIQQAFGLSDGRLVAHGIFFSSQTFRRIFSDSALGLIVLMKIQPYPWFYVFAPIQIHILIQCQCLCQNLNALEQVDFSMINGYEIADRT